MLEKEGVIWRIWIQTCTNLRMFMENSNRQKLSFKVDMTNLFDSSLHLQLIHLELYLRMNRC